MPPMLALAEWELNGGRSALDDLRRNIPGEPGGISPGDIFLKLETKIIHKIKRSYFKSRDISN
jgi:hypothetical protein